MTDVIIAFLFGMAAGGAVVLVCLLIFAHVVFKAADEDEDIRRLENQWKR